MAIDNDGDQSNLSLGELFKNHRNTTAGTAVITLGSGTNGQNLKMSDLYRSTEFSNNSFVGDTTGSYRRDSVKEARVGYSHVNYSTDTVDPIYITNRKKARKNTGTGTPTYHTIPSSGEISLDDFRNVSESYLVVDDTCGQTLTTGSYRLFGQNPSYGNKWKDLDGNNLAAVVYNTSYKASNQTHTMNLGTVCAAGDTVLLLQVFGGGSVRPATTYSAARAKLLNQNGTVSVTASSNDVIYPSNEYEGGSGYSDTAAQVQKIVASGGENQLQVYAQHSGTTPYTMATIVLRSGLYPYGTIIESNDSGGVTPTLLSNVIHLTSENTQYNHALGTVAGGQFAMKGFLSVTLLHEGSSTRFYADSRGNGAADITAYRSTMGYGASRGAIYQRETTYDLSASFGKGGESYSYNPDQTAYIYFKSAYNASSKGGGVEFMLGIY